MAAAARWMETRVGDGEEEVIEASKQDDSVLDVSADDGFAPGFTRLFATKSRRDTFSTVEYNKLR